MAFLPKRQKKLFLEQFQKDLDFFRVFFILANKSGVIRHMGVAWAEDGPAAKMGLRSVVGTAQAVNSPCARFLNCDSELDPEFCRIVNDFGAHEAESCHTSDRAAARACRETGKTQIYRCHAGLVDIAVPVRSEGDYIGTLLCGQLLLEPPTETSFAKVRESLIHLEYIDFDRLRSAYWRVPVSTDAEIQRAVNLMESFAEYLATSWRRLFQVIQEGQRAQREEALLRMEFVQSVLEGSIADREYLIALLQQLEVRRSPNRVLLARIGPEQSEERSDAFLEVRTTACLHVIEEIVEDMKDVVLTYLRKRGICVLLHDPGPETPDRLSVRMSVLAQRIAPALKRIGELEARIGIGRIKEGVEGLAESYEEALAALSQTAGTMVCYREDSSEDKELATEANRVAELLLSRQLPEARRTASALAILASRKLGRTGVSLEAHRRFFRSTVYPVAAAARQIGANPGIIEAAVSAVDSKLSRIESIIAVHEAFASFVGEVLKNCTDLYAGRARRLADRALQMIREAIESDTPTSRLSPTEIAKPLGISASHLSRTLRQVTGFTFERLVMEYRVDYAKKLLLNPELNVSQVAEQSGFCDSGYFARVFRRVAGCSPREFMRDPLYVSRSEPEQHGL